MRVAVLALSVVPLLHGQSGSPGPKFRTDVSLVRVDAQVVGRNGPVTGLGKESFVVLDNGKPQPIVYFGIGNDPVDLLLLIDRSGSMYPLVAEIAAAAVETLSVLQAGDRVGVVLFDQRTEVVIPPTAKMREVASALEYAVRGEGIRGGTNINGAVFDAAQYLLRQPKTDARRSILILTDNQSIKFKSDRAVIQELWEADAVLNALIFQSGLDVAAQRVQRVSSPWRLVLDANVTRIAEQTGGEWLRAGAAVESLRGMLERIRKRYTLHFRAPPGPAGLAHSVRVELAAEVKRQHPDARVHSRRGYVSVEESR